MLTELSDRLSLIVDARTDGAVSSIRRLSAEEKAAADRADVLKAKLAELEARAARQASRPSGVASSTTAQLSRTRSELAGLESTLATVPAGAGTAEKALAKLGLQGTVTGTALASGLSTAAAGLAVFGTFEFLKAGVENFTHLADEIRAVQQASTGSAEDSSRLVAITTALGVSSDAAALGVFRLGKNIAEQPEKLGALGIAIARTKNGNTDLIGTLSNVAAAYQKTSDGSARAKIVYEAFGRAGTSMLPILNANADKLKEIAAEAGKQGRIFSQADLDSAKEYEITIRELQDSLQGLTIAAGRDVVPVLSKIAQGMNDLADAANKVHHVSNKLHLLAPFSNAFKVATFGLVHFGGGPSAHDKAAAETAAAAALAQQQALVSAALGTLGDTSTLLASPGQGLTDAKQNLADAKQALADAKTMRDKATKDLASTRAGAPGADATSIEAAVARVRAAEAKLRAAEYVGGDARVSSAKASLLSAQESLNKLREKGGTSTEKLAAATERLHKANEAVASAQRKEKAAQQARNQATGLGVADIERQLRAKFTDQTVLTGAEAKLAHLGADKDLLALLNTENQQTPGTLVKVAKGATAALVAGLNDELAKVNESKDLFARIAATPDEWQTAGATRGDKFARGFISSLGVYGLSGTPAPSALYDKGIAAPGTRGARTNNPLAGGLYGPQVNLNGPVTVQAQDPAEFGRKLAARRRSAALSGARLD